MSVLRFRALAVMLMMAGGAQVSRAVDGPVIPAAHFNYYEGGCAGCPSSGVCCDPACGVDGNCGCASQSCGCGGGGCGGCDCGGCDPCHDGLFGGPGLWPCGGTVDPPTKLFDGDWLTSRGMNLGGWVAQSYTWNPYQPVDNFNGPVTWTDRANEYQLNEVYLYLRKVADSGGSGFAFGYGIDGLYGTSYRWNTAAGLETKLNNGNFYGLALPNLYGDVAYNNWTLRVGHFASPVGYYAIGTNNNFFPVLPYTYQYGEPFTHTGGLLSYKVNDQLSLGAGIVRGWDNFGSFNPNLSYIGTANYTRENGDTIGWFGILGNDVNLSGANGGFSTRYMQSLVYIKQFSDDITGVLQSDFGTQSQATANGQAAWYGVNGYLYWNMTCRWQWGLNAEWFRDDGGFRVGTLLPSVASPGARGWTQPGGAVAGFNGSFYRATFGPRYFVTPNFYVRGAALFDAYVGSTDANGNRPFDDGTKNHQQLGVFDAVWTF